MSGTSSSEAANPQVRCTDSKRNAPGRDREGSNTLLPCPFCGAEPEPINGGEYMFFGHDDTCHFEIFRRARSVKMVPDEIAAWNARAESAGYCEHKAKGGCPWTQD